MICALLGIPRVRRREHRSNTSLAQAVLAALNAVQTAEAATGPLPASIVLLSDGGSNVNPPLPTGVDSARDEHVTVSTVALGTPAGEITLTGNRKPVPVGTGELTTLARDTGGVLAAPPRLPTVSGKRCYSK